jgi:hypothetical protein
MLSQLLQAVAGMLKGGGGAGDDSACACSGETTTRLVPFGGAVPPGKYFDTLNKRRGGKWTGSVAPGGGYCGEKMVNGKCINPEKDMAGDDVIGRIPPEPALKWGG